jgi:fructose-bisphosphate aldolase, class I
MTGLTIRQARLFGVDGRTVIAALDHGQAGMAPLAALTQPGELIAAVTAAGADAVLTTPGIARRYAASFRRIGLILRVDAGPTALTGRWGENRVALRVADALRLGADGVAAMGIVGADGESESLRGLEQLAAACHRWGVPLLAEMLPGGLDAKEVRVEQVAIAARVGAELGADIVKIRYAGDPRAYREVTAGCYRPLVILGGSRQTDAQLLAQVREALDAGAVGVAVGRNIWQHPDPQSITRALVEAVHG